MKNFSLDTRRRHEQDLRKTKDEWINKWSKHVKAIAKYQDGDSDKAWRSTDYTSIGILDSNDLMQEAYLAFLTAWGNVKWNEVNEADSPDAFLWAFLKKSANLNLAKNLRKFKDSIRIPERVAESGELARVTGLFHQLDKMFMNIEGNEEVMLNYEAELLGFFLDSHLDSFLDKKVSGERSLKGIERDVIKKLFGIESELGTYTELAKYYEVSQSTLRTVKQKALKKLKSNMSMRIIADFVQEYKITTSSYADIY